MLVYVDLYSTKRHHSGLRCIKIVGGWALPQTSLGSLQRSPRPPSWFWGGGGGEEGEGREKGRGEGGGRGGEPRRGRGGRGQKERPGTTFFTL